MECDDSDNNDGVENCLTLPSNIGDNSNEYSSDNACVLRWFLDLATLMALTLMLALKMAMAIALMPTRTVVVQTRVCRKRLRIAGAGVDAGADAVAYAGADADADACVDAGTNKRWHWR